MRRTLLFIPHEIAGLPVFGIGWILILFAIFVVVRLLVARRSGQSFGELIASESILWGIVAAAIVFVLPMVELKNLEGEPVGVAVRGYGVFLLIAVVSSVALAAIRAKRSGMNPETIYSLAPWVFVAGIVGARVFYVVQYFENFVGETPGQTVRNMLMFNEGGLVVYGSFIGGFLAAVGFVYWRKLPLLKLGDIIVPCMFLGVFFGRLGCLMNGCCYGGRCDDGVMALHFPPGSRVYEDQAASGELIGLRVDEETGRILAVEEDSLAAQRGIEEGQIFRGAYPVRPRADSEALKLPAEDVPRPWVVEVSGREYPFRPDELPPKALPVRAAQIISSVSALTLCIALCFLSRWKFRDGTLMMLGFASYAVLRFVLEIVRVDEAGQFDTALTISQWVSIVVLICSVAGMAWIQFTRREPA
ncbi:prolipoprotein diacylglyceryl transferase [Stieleria varia]|uniref:Phosphatidylglycerol--prolipoprotein diacylglyceryl transferase n=1 Tax=Stieleria varia TaxID=2528005 RepID=A0A5C6A1R9_9BACT|nr:prolipoprotein diacylglyceryl transferase family protein [Stieleria varia]TWT93804.1 Prolipoprotein diacylglyceryl transferase [Stieleria varia]